MIVRYLQNLIRVLAIGAGFAAIPLVASLADLQPPWPPAIGYVSAGLILLASTMAWEWTRNAKRIRRRRWIAIAAGLTVLGLLSYLILYSLFIETIPGSDRRLIRGFACTFEAQAVYADRCPELPRDALRDAEWEPANLWTRGSITTVRVLLTIFWLFFVAGLIAAVGSIVAGRQFSSEPARRSGSPDA